MMVVSKFKTKLNQLVSKDTITRVDCHVFIKSLSRLCELVEADNLFETYSPVIKEWISSYEKIFSASRIVGNVEKDLNKLCPTTTDLYLKLLNKFHQFEPKYSQQFYSHWKTAVSRIKPSRRAASCIDNISRFQVLIKHLRTAVNRCEQLSILTVLILYTEEVPIDELNKLKGQDNVEVVDRLIPLMQSPTTMHQHEFLHDINAMGHSIVSVKPKTIICQPLSLQYNVSESEMWIDFNLIDNSIVFTTVSLSNENDHCLAMASRPKIKDSVSEDHMMAINATWNILMSKNVIQKKVTIKIFLRNEMESSFWECLRNVFRFVRPGNTETKSQVWHTDCTENGFTTRAIDDSNIESSYGNSERNQSIVSSFKYVLPTNTIQVSKSQNQNVNLLSETNYRVGDGEETVILSDEISVEECSVDPKLTQVNKRSVPAITENLLDDDVTSIGDCSIDSNLTQVIGKSGPAITENLLDDDVTSVGDCSIDSNLTQVIGKSGPAITENLLDNVLISTEDCSMDSKLTQVIRKSVPAITEKLLDNVVISVDDCSIDPMLPQVIKHSVPAITEKLLDNVIISVDDCSIDPMLTQVIKHSVPAITEKLLDNVVISVDDCSIDPMVTQVIKQSVPPITEKLLNNVLISVEDCSIDPRLTQVIKQSVPPITEKPMDNDQNVQSDISDNFSIFGSGKYFNNSVAPLSEDDDVSSGISFCDDISIIEDNSHDVYENEDEDFNGDESGGDYYNNSWEMSNEEHRSNEKNQIDKLIQPGELTKGEDSVGNKKCVYFSKVPSSASKIASPAHSIEYVEIISQPTTCEETSLIRNYPTQNWFQLKGKEIDHKEMLFLPTELGKVSILTQYAPKTTEAYIHSSQISLRNLTQQPSEDIEIFSQPASSREGSSVKAPPIHNPTENIEMSAHDESPRSSPETYFVNDSTKRSSSQDPNEIFFRSTGRTYGTREIPTKKYYVQSTESCYASKEIPLRALPTQEKMPYPSEDEVFTQVKKPTQTSLAEQPSKHFEIFSQPASSREGSSVIAPSMDKPIEYVEMGAADELHCSTPKRNFSDDSPKRSSLQDREMNLLHQIFAENYTLQRAEHIEIFNQLASSREESSVIVSPIHTPTDNVEMGAKQRFFVDDSPNQSFLQDRNEMFSGPARHTYGARKLPTKKKSVQSTELCHESVEKPLSLQEKLPRPTENKKLIQEKEPTHTSQEMNLLPEFSTENLAEQPIEHIEIFSESAPIHRSTENVEMGATDQLTLYSPETQFSNDSPNQSFLQDENKKFSGSAGRTYSTRKMPTKKKYAQSTELCNEFVEIPLSTEENLPRPTENKKLIQEKEPTQTFQEINLLPEFSTENLEKQPSEHFEIFSESASSPEGCSLIVPPIHKPIENVEICATDELTRSTPERHFSDDSQ